MYHVLFICSAEDRYLGWYCILAAANRTVMNMVVVGGLDILSKYQSKSQSKGLSDEIFLERSEQISTHPGDRADQTKVLIPPEFNMVNRGFTGIIG